MPRKPPREIQVGDKVCVMQGIAHYEKLGQITAFTDITAVGTGRTVRLHTTQLDQEPDVHLLLGEREFIDLDRCQECDCYKAEEVCRLCSGYAESVDPPTGRLTAECIGNRPAACACSNCRKAIQLLGRYQGDRAAGGDTR
jgi:hypothetical protein